MKKISVFTTLLCMLIGSTSLLTSCNKNQEPTSSLPSSTTITPTTTSSASSTSSIEKGKVTEVKITNEKKNYFIGDTVKLEIKLTTIGENPNTSLTFLSSDKTIATVDENGLVAFLKKGSVTIEARSSEDASIKDTILFEVAKKVPTEITILNEAVSGRVGEEFELNYQVTPEECANDVEIQVSDSQILGIKENKIQLLKEGNAEVIVVSKEDATVKATLAVSVGKAKPTAIKINQKEVKGYIGDHFTLSYEITPNTADEQVKITVEDPSILTIKDHEIELIKEGNTTIQVTSVADESVFDTLSVTVLATDFVTSKDGYSLNVDYTHMNDAEEPYLTTNAVSETDNPHAFAMFNVSGTKYYAEATVSMVNSSSDGWARFGIGSASDDKDGCARAFFFSPKEGQKTVMMDVPNGWGAITAQSMIWQANGINTLDPSDMKLGILRDGDNYYYTINDKLYWFEINQNFHDVATYPTLIAKDTQINIFNWSFYQDEDKINEKLALPAMQQRFFNADTGGRVNFVSDNEFTISGGDFFQNASVKSIGDRALLKGNFEIEFDLSNVGADASNDNNTRIGVALRKVGVESPFVADTFAMTNNGAQAFDYRTFTWSGGEHSYWQGQDSAVRASGDQVNGHYKLSRTILENGNSTLTLYFEGTKVLEVTVNYVGDYHPIFGANLASGTFKNITLKNM